ncbi:peptide ABC transporter substrate-binding protein [Nesterenkonia muleiensis]|uniref:peptide ABC transporter substrate-binding protein n=1 Tax=Nesterenkonia muleiensis TaxID=2282648 RepID=UPI000E76CD3A|nr:ABC transporter substrate-binding protein [Nesterenkonia muleiensis]
MVQTTKRTALTATSLSAALVLAACGGDNGENGEADAGQAETGGEFSTYLCEPQSLTPGMSTEVCGAGVLEQLFTGLTEMDYEANEPVAGVAESWESEDNITWTFELGEDWTFHNGEELTAQTFVDTFNWTVDPDNAQANAEYYDFIAGYSDVVEGEADELEGVSAVDDYTLEIVLEEPFGQLPALLSLVGFSPLPEAAYDDMDAFESAPVGNGRYEMDGEWEHDVQIVVNRFEEWSGEQPGAADRIEFRIYNDVSTAYQDVQAGNLDLLYNAPPENIPMMEDDFGDNQGSFETGTLTFLGIPTYQDDYADVEIRQALSMAVDRQEIIDNIFDGALTAAGSFLPPVLPEGREDACEYCEFDPERAASLYEEAGGASELTVYFNSGAGHDAWVEAVSNQWRENLPIDDVSFQSLEFAQYLDLLEEGEIEGPYRLGWTLSYPSAQESLEPMYSSTASRNYTGFASDEFDERIAQANAADADDAVEAYQHAEDILLEELPVIPMWFERQDVVWSENIDNVHITPRGLPQVERVEVQN